MVVRTLRRGLLDRRAHSRSMGGWIMVVGWVVVKGWIVVVVWIMAARAHRRGMLNGSAYRRSRSLRRSGAGDDGSGRSCCCCRLGLR